ncbi:MAG: D-alanyl-D-alanine carboxypeptidase, partial [Clostridia bacterium]|nr:D-alanyl-D-alanine carboxypeptidase [Clostridia bacterium]
MKKLIFCFTLCLLLICNVCRASEISAKSAVLYDCFSEKTLYERAADAPLPMASTTKIMTCLLSCELFDPEQTVTVRPEWCNILGSSMYLRPDESIKIKDLLCGLMLMSGNDAAVALASVKTGNVSDFVGLMNEKARSLGMDNTHFTNPSGLDDELHYTSANDLRKLTSFALENPLFAQICALKQTQAAGRFMANHNKLLFTFEGAVGVKTGNVSDF